MPVSLGIVLDTSGSMEGEKMLAAKQALQRFLFELLGEEDEVFLYRFDNRPELVSPWTRNKDQVAAELRRHSAARRHDAVRRDRGSHSARRNRTQPQEGAAHHLRRQRLEQLHEDRRAEAADSRERSARLRDRHRRDDADASRTGSPWFSHVGAAPADAVPVPDPRRPAAAAADDPAALPAAERPIPTPGGSGSSRGTGRDEAVNVRVLREITDTSGGRTEIIWQPRDLDGATAGIADELSKQYFLGYPAGSDKKDGRWHAIRVEVEQPELHRPGASGVRGDAVEGFTGSGFKVQGSASGSSRFSQLEPLNL